MTTQEIQDYVHSIIDQNFKGYEMASEEVMTSAEGDGRFMGKVSATRYGGVKKNGFIFLAIGETELNLQIVKFGMVECTQPSEDDLNVMLQKELGIQFSA